MKIKSYILAVILLLFGVKGAFSEISMPVSSGPSNGIPAIEPFNKTDRVLIFVPHPDDETIGCAGVIQNALKSGSDLRVVYLTNGDHNQFAFIVYEKRLVFKRSAFIYLGELRKKEAIRAMKIMGLDESNMVFLGYPDFGTFAVFARYWEHTKPYMSWLTRISSVPYKGDMSYEAVYTGESILSDLKRVLLEYKPTKIFVSHPADTNPDHKAFFLFLEVALADLEKYIHKPKVYSYLIHSSGWPLPRQYHPELTLEPPRQFLNSSVQWEKIDLTAEELNRKYMAILAYKSQTESSAFYLLSFARRNELFGNYPQARLIKESQENSGEQLLGVSILDDLMRTEELDEPIEKDALILRGKGSVRYELKDSCLVVSISKPRESLDRFNAMVYLFGYSQNTPFSHMPKICVIIRKKTFQIFDTNRLLDSKGVSMDFNDNEVVLKLPLKILGDPDFVLASVRVQTGPLQSDASAFRKIILK